MAIYNLGQLQAPTEEANPYMEMLMKFGLQSALGQQEIAGKKEIATAQGEAEAKTLLLKRDWEREDMTRKNVMAAWQSWSDKPDDVRKMFPTTPEGKEFFKFAKSYVPKEMFDSVGAPIALPSTKDTIKQQLDAQIAGVKNKLLANGPDSLSEGERNILQMEGWKDEIAQVTADLYRNSTFLSYLEDPEAIDPVTKKPFGELAQDIAQQALKIRIGMRGNAGTSVNELSSYIGGGSQPLFYGPTAKFPGIGNTPISKEVTPQETKLKVKRFKPIP